MKCLQIRDETNNILTERLEQKQKTKNKKQKTKEDAVKIKSLNKSDLST